MKTSLTLLRRLFGAMLLLVAALLSAFLLYLYLVYGGLLTGDVQTGQEPELLTSFDEKRFDAAVERMGLRRSLPDVEAEPRNPFGVPAGR